MSLAQQAQLARVGGVVCGQAMMAAADTCMALALMQHGREVRPCTTAQSNASFVKPLAGQDGLIRARVIRAGHTPASGDIHIQGANDLRCVGRASTRYAWL